MNSLPIPAKHPHLTAAQRKANYRARLQADGLQTINAAVEAGTAARLKNTARERDYTLGEAIDVAVRAAEAGQRKAAWRAKIAAEGRQVVNLSLDAETAFLLCSLAKRDKCSPATVIAAALALAANTQLLQDVRAWVAERLAKAAEQVQ